MKAFKWILSPIGAIAAMFVAHLLPVYGTYFIGIIDWWGVLISPMVESIAFVCAGAYIAPTTQKRTVAIVYATILSVICVINFILALGLDYKFMQYVSIIVGFIGAVIAPLFVENEKQ